MKRIGKLLKKSREDKGLSVGTLSERTQITERRLKAIEEGDIDYFHDDTSFVRRYVRAYCREVGVDYATVEDELNEALRKYDSLRDEDFQFDRLGSEPVTKKQKSAMRKKDEPHFRFDLRQFGMTLLVAGIVILLGYILINYILPKFRVYETAEDKNITDTEVREETAEMDLLPVRIDTISERRYAVFYTPGSAVLISIEITEEKTYVGRFILNGEELASPEGKEYDIGEVSKMCFTPAEGDEVVAHLQTVRGNRVFINEEEVVIDEKLAQSGGGLQLYFTFTEGEFENESAE